MPHAVVRAIEYHLPASVLTNDDLASVDATWSAAAIEAKTGIHERRIAAPDECASDLGVAAARRLLESGICAADDVDYLLFCTQCPDYFLPTTACLLQERLGLRTDCGALDVNLGCSGYVYGLGLAKGLIETGQARRLLLVTADTYSKYLNPADLHVRTIFGDGAAATLIEASHAVEGRAGECLGPFVYGTDGRGAENLIVAEGGWRGRSDATAVTNGRDPDIRPRDVRLVMNGPEIFRFTIEAVPRALAALLDRSGLDLGDIQLFVFHQANQFMLDHLRRKTGIPEERFCLSMRHCGNTVSASIPIALKHALMEGRVRPGDRVVLVGFGVGYSWAATVLRWAA